MIKHIVLVAALALLPSFVKADAPELATQLKPLEWMIGEWQVDDASLDNSGYVVAEASPVVISFSKDAILVSYSYFCVPEMFPAPHLGARIANAATITWNPVNDSITLKMSEKYANKNHLMKYAEPTRSTVQMEARGKDQWGGLQPKNHVLIRRIGEDKISVIFDTVDSARLKLKCNRVETGTAKTAKFEVLP